VHVRAGTGPVLLVAGDLEFALERGTDDLRDRTVLRFDREQVRGLRAEALGGTVWAVERRPAAPDKGGALEGWDLVAPSRAPAQADKVTAALQGLSWLRALRFAGGAGAEQATAAGLAPPRRTYVLLGAEGKEIGRVEVGREANDSVFVRSSAGPRVMEADKASLAALPAAAADLVEKPAEPAGGPPKGQENRKG
jgi:hypothetical protein